MALYLTVSFIDQTGRNLGIISANEVKEELDYLVKFAARSGLEIKRATDQLGKEYCTPPFPLRIRFLLHYCSEFKTKFLDSESTCLIWVDGEVLRRIMAEDVSLIP